MLRKRSNKSSAAEIASISSPSVSRNNSQNGGSSSGPRYYSTAGSGENASGGGGRRPKAIPPPPLNLGLADFNSELCRTVLGLVLTQNAVVRLLGSNSIHRILEKVYMFFICTFIWWNPHWPSQQSQSENRTSCRWGWWPPCQWQSLYLRSWLGGRSGSFEGVYLPLSQLRTTWNNLKGCNLVSWEAHIPFDLWSIRFGLW